MKHNSRDVLAFAACLLMPLAFSGNAFATNHVTSCLTVITTSGLWVLDNDLTCTATAIYIETNNVTLKLQGHTITGPGGSTTFDGILVSTGTLTFTKNVTILGPGTITGFYAGINFFGTEGGGVVDVKATNNFQGLYLSADVQGNNSSNLLVTGNLVQSNTDGIYVEETVNSVIAGNNVASNTSSGIWLALGTGTSILGNVSDNNGFDGITIGGVNANFSASGITLEGNTTNSNVNMGIDVLDPGTAIFFKGNTALSNAVFDISDWNVGCATDTYRSDVFGTANQTCVK